MPEPFWLTVFFISGAAIASFVTVVANRWIAGEDFISKRSSCDSCKSLLGVRDLIPIFSWLGYGGKCRYCRKPIPKECLYGELFLGIVFAVIYLQYGLSIDSAIISLLASTLLCLIIIDIREQIIPDTLQVIVAALGIAYNVYQGFDEDYIISAAVCGGGAYILQQVFFRIKGVHGLGMGDVKFMAAGGLWLPLFALPPFLFLAGVLGVLSNFILYKDNGRFAFGPALALSLLIFVVTPELSTYYWGMFKEIADIAMQ